MDGHGERGGRKGVGCDGGGSTKHSEQSTQSALNLHFLSQVAGKRAQCGLQALVRASDNPDITHSPQPMQFGLYAHFVAHEEASSPQMGLQIGGGGEEGVGDGGGGGTCGFGGRSGGGGAGGTAGGRQRAQRCNSCTVVTGEEDSIWRVACPWSVSYG